MKKEKWLNNLEVKWNKEILGDETSFFLMSLSVYLFFIILIIVMHIDVINISNLHREYAFKELKSICIAISLSVLIILVSCIIIILIINKIGTFGAGILVIIGAFSLFILLTISRQVYPKISSLLIYMYIFGLLGILVAVTFIFSIRQIKYCKEKKIFNKLLLQKCLNNKFIFSLIVLGIIIPSLLLLSIGKWSLVPAFLSFILINTFLFFYSFFNRV
jgi:hypothetical protein